MVDIKVQCRICSTPWPQQHYYYKNGKHQQRRWICRKCLIADITQKAKVRHALVVKEVLTHYSGGMPCCSCPNCTETNIEFLTIDHINGGGTKHRKKIGNSYQFYRWLRNNKFPDGFRVLCMNCNHSRGIHGYCPHERMNNVDSRSIETINTGITIGSSRLSNTHYSKNI